MKFTSLLAFFLSSSSALAQTSQSCGRIILCPPSDRISVSNNTDPYFNDSTYAWSVYPDPFVYNLNRSSNPSPQNGYRVGKLVDSIAEFITYFRGSDYLCVYKATDKQGRPVSTPRVEDSIGKGNGYVFFNRRDDSSVDRMCNATKISDSKIGFCCHY